MFPKIVVPCGTLKSSILIGFSIYKPSILGYHYFWKHPYITFCYLLREKQCRIAKLVFKKLVPFVLATACRNIRSQPSWNGIKHFHMLFEWLSRIRKKNKRPNFPLLTVFVSDPVGVPCELVAILSWSPMPIVFCYFYNICKGLITFFSCITGITN